MTTPTEADDAGGHGDQEDEDHGDRDDDGESDGDDDDEGNDDGRGTGDGPPSLTSSADRSLFSLSNLSAGKTVARCISITYVGGRPADVRLYASQTGTGLADYLDVRVTRGRGRAADGSCAGFQPDTIDYAGLGLGVLYEGSLSAFPAHAADSLLSGVPWQSGETHTYRITMALASEEAAQGRSVFFDFVWGAAP